MASITIDDLYREAEMLGVRIRERRLPEHWCGAYVDDYRLIVLDETLLDHQRLCTLAHELVHARYHDRSCNPLSSGMLERRARRESMLRLIDRESYRMAERVYDEDVYAIACELGVTVRMVRCYQRYLHDQGTVA
ncbi:ImmA/IrrE family metallo-endopeptidase [Bifidobacterium vansinderenii]|uniref:IrrE N-terminal-like domain-containing protein n=1 Tax=Bifidobacterium vansinderenii TaxID=1984871 RepID=A0A229W0S3_9BIFI|nr:ImmA/IrrE family metallo-endopeptidase [Bifidobacterium vansinderenii]OXN01441.1 hypothetical protein Tam10B_0444 [Bifidobacterium vansinderenii]